MHHHAVLFVNVICRRAWRTRMGHEEPLLHRNEDRKQRQIATGYDLDVASSKSRDLDGCPRSLTPEATMNSTGAVARANSQIAGILLWLAPRRIMMRKLFCQVTVVAFTSLSLVSASLADDTKAQPSTKSHLSAGLADKTKAQRSTKSHLSAGLADKTNAQRSTKSHRSAGLADKTSAQPSAKAHRLVIQV